MIVKSPEAVALELMSSFGTGIWEANALPDKPILDIESLIAKFKIKETPGTVYSEPEILRAVPEKTPVKKERRVRKAITECLFYAALILIVAVVFSTAGGTGNTPRSIFGYTASTVLTNSMQSELPKGSVIVTKQVDSQTLEVNDNITFVQSDNTTVTHKIVGIYENYDGSGQRAFVTQGTENGMADDDVVWAENVVGKVVWHSMAFGNAFNYVKDNFLFVVLMIMLTAGFFIALRVFIAPGKKQNKERGGEHAGKRKSRGGHFLNS